jgi:transmembrane sensor
MHKTKNMAPKDLGNLIKRYLQGKSTAEESDFINAWYGSLGQQRESKAEDVTEEKMAFLEKQIQEKLQKHVEMTLTSRDVAERKPSIFLWPYSGIAASLVMCLAFTFYFFKGGVESKTIAVEKTAEHPVHFVENSTDGVKRVILSDGTLLELAPKSNIRFSNDASSASRELFLEGEAYFDVAHNSERPFYVYAGDIVTRVLGTSFIIRATQQHDRVTVSVRTGKVTVYSRKASHKKTVLVPYQEAVYDRKSQVVATQAIPEQGLHALKRNVSEMHFEETAVSEVLSTLRKTYDIEIIFEEESLSGCVLTSTFIEEGLYDRIDVICTAIGATYRIVDSKIVIESNGCNLKP